MKYWEINMYQASVEEKGFNQVLEQQSRNSSLSPMQNPQSTASQ